MDKDIKSWLEKAFVELFNSADKDLIDRKLKEECINHRLAYYLEKFKPKEYKDYYADLEYNKNFNDPKGFEIEGGYRKIRPDIIVHRRTESKEGNLIAIECKKGSILKTDIEKLKKLSSGDFNYKICLGISYMPGKEYFLLKLNENNYKALKILKDDDCKIIMEM